MNIQRKLKSRIMSMLMALMLIVPLVSKMSIVLTYAEEAEAQGSSGVDIEDSDVQVDDSDNLIMYGNAKRLDDGVIQLTELQLWQAGSAWLSHQINTEKGFKVTFSYWAGGGRDYTYGGADGFVLMFSPETGLGGSGIDLGVVNGSYGVELDSYRNGHDPGVSKHIAIIKDSSREHIVYKEDDRVDDSQWHTLTVTYEKQLLKVYLDEEEVLSCEDIALPEEVCLGISATTGAGKNEHLIKDFFFEGVTANEDNCPIVIIPGVMGSQLYAGDKKVWDPHKVDVTVNLSFRLDEYMAIDKVLSVHNYDNSEGNIPINQATLPEDAREYGAISIYKTLVDEIINAFTDENGDCTRAVYFYSYDFRLDNELSAYFLKVYIDEILLQHPEYTKVDIVAHSMGGLVTSSYVSNYTAEKVNKVITAGTPYEGAPELANSVLTWVVLDDGWKNFGLTYLGGLTKECKASFPAIAQLAPTDKYFARYYYLFGEYAAYKNYEGYEPSNSYDNLEIDLDRYHELNYMVFGDAYGKVDDDNNKDALGFHDKIKIDNYNILAGLDKSYFIIGINQKTISGLTFYNGNNDLDGMKIKDLSYETLGDGTVPYASSTMMNYLETLPEGRVKYFATTHTGIVGDKDDKASAQVNENSDKAVQCIIDILRSGKSDVVSNAAEKKPYIVIRVACPVDVTVEKNGEVLCSDAENLQYETSYGVLDFLGEDAEIKMLCLDNDVDYDICLNGTGEGTMDYSIRYYSEDDELLQDYDFINVPITEETRISTGTDKSDIRLDVDSDNDGVVDYTLQAEDCEENGLMQKITDTSYLYISDGIEVEYNITAQYGNTYHTNVTINNKTDETIYDWILEFDSNDIVTSVWDGVLEGNEGMVVVKNSSYNKDIKPGESVSFGFMATSQENIDIPSYFDLKTQKVMVDNGDYQIEYCVNENWENSYSATIVLSNISDEIIDDWSLEFDFMGEITSIWEAEIANKSDNHYVLNNIQQNQSIAPGQIIEIDIVVSAEAGACEPGNWKLNKVIRK